MTPWEVIHATAGRLGREYLHLTMAGRLSHYPEGSASTPDHRWVDFKPSKGVRIAALGDHETPFTSWARITRTLRERIDPEPIRPAWDAYQAAWAEYLALLDPHRDGWMKGTVTDDLRDRYEEASAAQFLACRHATDLLREQIANPPARDLLDLLEGTDR